MYRISIDTAFKASHQLTFADGTQEPLHMHQWCVTAAVSADTLNAEGLVMDFCHLERGIQEAISPYQEKQLENTSYFAGRNASAEQVAKAIFDAVAPRIPAPARLDYVEVTEAPGCRARYQPKP